MSRLTHKGYARIYCETEGAVPAVHAIIREIDEYEFGYMPKNLVAPFSEYPAVTYVHKFSDMDMDKLTALCWARGIKIWVFDAGRNEYPESAIGATP